MARPEAQSVGLYYPTPTHLLPAIASTLAVGSGEDYSVVDPCAADGEAVMGVVTALFDKTTLREVDLYACELEKTRYDALARLRYGSGLSKVDVEHGDALRLVWSTEEKYGAAREGASLLFLNPPYDHDREVKRLEERFLRRFAACLSDRGVLVYLVPFYALEASADTLAREFADLHCFRFPDPDFDIFKQVVLVGSKRSTLAEPDPSVRAQVLRWAASVADMPVLGSAERIVEVPGHADYKSGFSKWSVAPLDVRGLLARLVPWHSTDRGGKPVPVPGVVPADGDLVARKYPLAVPPKPAHLAAAIASGVFNGAEVRPDDASSRLPRLRVKGVFDREFVKVDEKQNKDGEKTGEIQVQQPKLVVTVLDVARGSYHTLVSSAEQTGSTDPSTMSTGDLLVHYGRGLMGVMREQCPVMHDPANDTERFTMPHLARPLYRAQEEAVRAAVKLLGGARASRAQRRGRAAFILGEIGSGKSGCALSVAEVIKARRVLVMCPPHLLQSWADQAAAVVPWARVSVLADVGDVDAFCTSKDDGMRIAILSREAGKLSHAFEGVGCACPRCGSTLPVSDDGIRMVGDELARKRMRCQATHRRPADQLARITHELALVLMLVIPRAPEVNQLLRGRHRDRMMREHGRRHEKFDAAAWGRAKHRLMPLVERLAALLPSKKDLDAVLTALLAAIDDDSFTASLVERLYTATVFDPAEHGAGASVRTWCRDALLLMKAPMRAAGRLKAMNLHATTSYAAYGACANVWDSWDTRAEALAAGKEDPEHYRTGIKSDGLHKVAKGSPECAVDALGKLALLGKWKQSRPCGEALFQAIPEPRRVALAPYLAKRYPRVVDLFVLDEAHEAANADSAQSLAAHRISGLGMPTLALTGSVMNGYAVSLFANQWALDPEFRKEFKRDALRDFNRRYGYIKQLVQETDKNGKVVEWGSQSDRRETAKEIGNAPGVLPLFTLRYLLRIAVTLHKSDLALDLPKHVESAEFVEPSPEILSRYEKMLEALKKQIKQDRFDPMLAGKLFGALSELPSYLDRATVDCGNSPDGSYEVAYPDNDALEGHSGEVIIRFDGLPESTVLPKERWMLDKIEADLKVGRRVMLFAWHEAVLPRLQKLVEREMKEPCALLLAGKVQAKKRQDWIDEKVIKPKRRVLAVNAAAVQTGLNNLVWFQTAVWMQNPAVNPIVKRQADGRVDRIGKKAQTESAFPVYANTAQALAHKLLMHKVGVSMATDGLDAESALQAAGVGSTESLDAFSVGRALFEMLERGEDMGPSTRDHRSANDAPRIVAHPTLIETKQWTAVQRSAHQLDLFGKVA